MKAPLIPAKVASKAVDKVWKMAGKTPRTSNPRAAKRKRQAYQHDPGGQRIKNLVAKPLAVSAAYGAEPTYAHKQAVNIIRGKGLENPYAKKPEPKNEKRKQKYATVPLKKDKG